MPTKKKSAVYKYNYYDENRKRHCKSFSAPTMREARLKAAEWEMNHPIKTGDSMTVLEAVERYITAKERILSPATIRGYESVKKTHIENHALGAIALADLTVKDIQVWINEAHAAGTSTKTIKNWYGLLEPSIRMQDKRFDFSDLSFPQGEKYIGHTPSNEEVKALMDYARKKENKDLYIAILLAAFGTMRRSEICALTDKDVHGNTISVTKDKVKDKDGVWVVKTTKTKESKRDIDFPDFVIDEIKGIKGDLIKCHPDALHHRFRRAIQYSGSPFFRFHDLRHYSASIMHALGVPDVYIRQRGGWASDHVMKRVYIDAMEEERKKQTQKIFTHFNQFEAKIEANIH